MDRAQSTLAANCPELLDAQAELTGSSTFPDHERREVELRVGASMAHLLEMVDHVGGCDGMYSCSCCPGSEECCVTSRISTNPNFISDEQVQKFITGKE